MNDNIIVGLDIGTKNIRVVVAEILDSGSLQILGMGSSASNGMRKGIVTNIETTVKGILDAVESAEMMSGLDIESCSIGLGGEHIEGLNSKGVFPVGGKGKYNTEISNEDINSVIESAKAIVIPVDREIIHVIPQSYTVDGQRNIKDPINMIGVRLEAEVHLITGAVTAISNIIRCVNRANLKVNSLMHYGLADIKSVVTKEEQELGALLIDIGAGTTDFVMIKNSAPVLTGCLPVGANQVTNDLAIVKGVSFDIAEKIKISAGCCWLPFIEENEPILLPGVPGKSPEEIDKLEICKIFQARMEEIFVMIKDKIKTMNKNLQIPNSIILCGGGALLNGVTELGDKVFENSSVRVGIPSTVGGLTGEYKSPEYAGVLGLVLKEFEIRERGNSIKLARKGNSESVKEKFKKILKGLF